MIQHLNHKRNLVNIFFDYDNFKKKIRIAFEIINEIIIFKKIVQYLTAKTFAIDYAQRFKVHFNKID